MILVFRTKFFLTSCLIGLVPNGKCLGILSLKSLFKSGKSIKDQCLELISIPNQ